MSFQAAQAGGNASYQQLRVTVRGASSTKTFVWSGNTIAEERDSTGAVVTKRYFDEGEQRVGGTDAVNYYYTRDHLGSVREVTDATGYLITQLDYDAWGNSVVLAGQMQVDFGYTGHYFHQPSGLNLAMYRAYSPTLGRWLSRDPLENPEMSQGANLYWYVRNNPTIWVDRLGEFLPPIPPIIEPPPIIIPRPIPIPPLVPPIFPPGGGGSGEEWHRCSYTCPSGAKIEHYNKGPCEPTFPHKTPDETGKMCPETCHLDPGGDQTLPFNPLA